MLTLPIKKKWFNMIISGEKTEEYREIKPYYDTRFINLMGLPKGELPDVKFLLRKVETRKRFDIMFRNGYSKDSPYIICECTLSINTGRAEWGAESDKEYYVLRIHNIKREKPNVFINAISCYM